MKCTLDVNGASVRVDVEPRELLVDLLRDRLRLTAAKVACDTAQCGSCIVEMNGDTVKSCQVLTVQANGSSVLTVEGLNGDRATAPLTDLQDRLWRAHGVQCGFCIPGVIMALRELLAEQPDPTGSQVRECLNGNLCRCTGYVAIVEAAMGVTGIQGSV